MNVTARTALEIIAHEAIVRQAYKDSVGVWTWGVGVTSASGHSVERYINNPQPMRKCLEIYIWLLQEKYAPAVRKAFEGCDLTQEQFAAALSFHWNTGAITRASWVKHFKAGNIAKAQKTFMAWKKPPEILNRRKAERDLFFYGVWSSDGTVTEFTKVYSNGNINWSSGVKRDVRGDIFDLLDPVPEPARKPAPEPPGFWADLIAALSDLFKGIRK